MKKYFKFSVIIWILFSSCTNNSFEFQPNVTWGGRIVALSKDPFNDNKIIAASPSGGIFISNSKGSSWSHINLPVFEMNDVKFSTSSSDIVVVTSARDLKKNNGGGIWRSEDGGKSWAKPATSVLIKDGKMVASHGFGISFEPHVPSSKTNTKLTNIRRVYVGTEWGVAISRDNGVTWKYNPLSPFAQIKVYSVLAGRNGMVIAATSNGIYRSTDGGSNWKFITRIIATASTRSLCYATANNNNVFVAADGYKIFYSGDFGNTWKEINSPGGQSREPFIRCTAQQTNFFGTNVMVNYLYYGNGVDLYRKILPNADNNTGNVFFANEWVKLSLDHFDPSDIIFDNNGTSLLLSGDGGVFNTPDGGSKWHITGSGKSGLNALQITEATAQENFVNGKQYYIYFGTQDNGMWASLDKGATWSATGNEGFSIQTKRRAILEEGNLMTYAIIDNISRYVSKQGYVDPADWKEVSAPAGEPVIVQEGDLLDPHPRDRFIQLSFSKGFSTNFVFKLDQYYFNNTLNGGENWNRIGRMSYAPTAQYPKISNDGEPTVYQPYFTGDTTRNGFGKIGLVKLSQTNRAAEGILENAGGNGFGSLGTFPTEFKWYNVLAVNPTDPNHVLIADIENSVIKVTKDGGKNWFAESALTNLITNSGDIEFYKIIDCCPKILVTCMSFNPDNPSQIAIGTRENGIFFTWDGGDIWYKLDNTNQITNASSIFFYFDGTIMVSTYGRGLWKFKPKESKVSTKSERIKLKGAYVFEILAKKLSALGNLEKAGIGKEDKLIAANTQDSSLTLLKLINQGTKFIEINTTGYDSIEQYGQLIHLSLPDEKEGEAILRQFPNDPFLDVPIRAFIYNGQHQVTGLVLSTEPYKLYRPLELVMKENTGPYIHLLDDSLNAITSLMRNETFYIKGVNFIPARSNEKALVEIYLGGRLYKSGIQLSEEGTFQVAVNLDETFANGLEIRVKQDVPSHPILLIKNVSIFREYEVLEKRRK